MINLVSGDIAVKSLSFSLDGQYLVTIGDLPECLVTVWDWKAGIAIASANYNSSPDAVSFNPLNSKQFCTCGADGKLFFWKLSFNLKSFSLKSISSSGSTSSDAKAGGPRNTWEFEVDSQTKSPPEAYIVAHVWGPGNLVFAIDKTSNTVCKYNPENGDHDVLFQGQQGKFTSLALNSKNIVVADDQGFISFYDTAGNEIKSIKVLNSAINALEFSPDYGKLVASSSPKGCFYDCKEDKAVEVLFLLKRDTM